MNRQSVLFARLTLIIAALLWSTGSFFSCVLREDTVFHLENPRLTPVQIAFWRGIFAGLGLVPLLRRGDITWHRALLPMMICFAIMSGLYLSALNLGNAANAILLQNTAPVWVYLIGVYLLGAPPDKLSRRSTILGLIGAIIIVIGNWPTHLTGEAQTEQVQILLMAASSGFMYACVVLFLNYLRSKSSAWLVVLNLLGTAFFLGSFVWVKIGTSEFLNWLAVPTREQFAFLAIFGIIQMALPYWLFARGLKTVTAVEAGIITLLEPIFNPVWAYLIAPDRERPTIWTFLGGSLLLAALVWRYLPKKERQRSVPSTE